MAKIPSWRTDQELPGVPLAWLKSDGKNPLELATMGAILKVQIVRQKAVVATQTSFLVTDDAIPNWVMSRFDTATLALIDTDLVSRECWSSQYYYVPMYRRPADSADDVWDPEANDGVGGFAVEFSRTPV